MAQAIRFHSTGGPEVLQLEQVEVGDPGPGEVRMRHVADRVERKARQKSSRSARSRQAVEIAPHEAALWDSLRETRARLAKEQGVPAYRIFADATLLQMLREQPQSLSELATISGVGEMKLARYGEDFLGVLTAF